jgi:hypothetical protein
LDVVLIPILLSYVVVFVTFCVVLMAIDQVNDTYDPIADPTRKAKSHDPGWVYGYRGNVQNRDQVTCILYKTVVCGGIKRLKQHLAGGYGDTTMCSNTTTAIRKQMKEYLESNKRRIPIFLNDQGDDDDVVEVDAPVVTQFV